MQSENWRRLGPAEQFKDPPLRQVQIGDVVIALSFRDGKFGAISGVCNHVGGPLGEGALSADGYVVCPWHSWQFDRFSGHARPGIPAAVPQHEVKVEGGDLFVNLVAAMEPAVPSSFVRS